MQVSQQPASTPSGPATLEDSLLILLRGIQKHSVVADASDEQLTKAIRTLSGAQQGAERLSLVEEQINAISAGDDLDAVKVRLSATIAKARAEALQERQTISDLLSAVVRKLEVASAGGSSEARTAESTGGAGPAPAPGPVGAVYTPDQLTGLPLRAHAEAELARAHALDQERYLVLFVVKRLALINAKFGYSRGDEVLRKVVAHLAQLLPDYNDLFRWTPCSFLTIAPPETAYKELRGRVQIIELSRLTPTLEWQGRSAMVQVAIDCRILSVKDFGTRSDLFLRLDTLAADA